MTPLAPPTEAEVKEMQHEVDLLKGTVGRLRVDRDRYRDAYLAQREALETICEIGETRDVIVARAALSAAPLAPETQNEGDG